MELSLSSRAIIICFKSEFSFFKCSTSPLSAVFSSSRKRALMAIWFSFRRRASRDLLAASLFLHLFAQYLLFFSSSGTNCFFRFRIIGCGFNSSSENRRVAGSKSCERKASQNRKMLQMLIWRRTPSLLDTYPFFIHLFLWIHSHFFCKNIFLDTHPFLSWDGGKAEVVLAKVDADGGGEAAKLLPLAVVAVLVVVIVELRLLRHPSHPLWGAGVRLCLTLLLQNNHPHHFTNFFEIWS